MGADASQPDQTASLRVAGHQRNTPESVSPSVGPLAGHLNLCEPSKQKDISWKGRPGRKSSRPRSHSATTPKFPRITVSGAGDHARWRCFARADQHSDQSVVTELVGHVERTKTMSGGGGSKRSVAGQPDSRQPLGLARLLYDLRISEETTTLAMSMAYENCLFTIYSASSWQ